MSELRRMAGRHWAADSSRAKAARLARAASPRLGLRAAAALASVLALGITGLGFEFLPRFETGGDILGPKSSDGSVNVLLIGLDSRKDQDGKDLPASTLAKLHAGDGQEGGYNTNTLILIHIPTGGGKAVAFSIPRDDYVSVRGIKGYRKIKIKEAYGLKKFEVENELAGKGVADRKTLERRGREAGRQETLQTVRDLLGVPIDQYAEVNLVGFYDVAKALGGIEVCLNHAVYDDYSGANFPAGRQTLDASQALSFVRQRHGLDNGDLDRTHRQQAFLAAVEHKLASSGTLSNLGELQSLVSAVQKDVVLSPKWDVVGFIQQIQRSTGGEVEFRTLPVERFDMVNEQSVNIIDAKKVAAEVQQAFGGRRAAPTTAAQTGKPTASAAAPSDGDGTTRPASADQSPEKPDHGKPVESGGIPCVD
ncbi:MAG: LCP family protein [Segniliparus sp.]|uniref:LCP family protein n=1 Tax=Segniliparus sp. TaxID=2804064 RepID=UPI003F2CA48B